MQSGRRKLRSCVTTYTTHLSDIDFDAKFSEAGISPDEIERLIEISKQLVNKLSYANDRSTFAFNLDPAKLRNQPKMKFGGGTVSSWPP
jgi:hypothetical protein